jgi:hypothetical protein
VNESQLLMKYSELHRFSLLYADNIAMAAKSEKTLDFGLNNPVGAQNSSPHHRVHSVSDVVPASWQYLGSSSETRAAGAWI